MQTFVHHNESMQLLKDIDWFDDNLECPPFYCYESNVSGQPPPYWFHCLINYLLWRHSLISDLRHVLLVVYTSLTWVLSCPAYGQTLKTWSWYTPQIKWNNDWITLLWLRCKYSLDAPSYIVCCVVQSSSYWYVLMLFLYFPPIACACLWISNSNHNYRTVIIQNFISNYLNACN